MTASKGRSAPAGGKSGQAFRTIGEVADDLELPQHVLRFWETRFSQIRPLKRGGNRRYYRPEDIELLRAIKTLLYEEGYTIKGVQKRFREQGVKAAVAAVLEDDAGGDGVEAVPNGRAEESSPAKQGGMPSQKPQAPHSLGAGPAAKDLREILEELKALRRLLE